MKLLLNRMQVLPSFLRGVLATGMGGASTLVLGVLGLTLSTRVLTAEALGIVFLTQVLILFLVEASSIGLHVALVQFYAGATQEVERLRIMSTATIFRAIISLIVAMVLGLSGSVLLPWLGIAPSPGLLMLLIGWYLLESQLRILFAFHEASFNFRVIGTVDVVSSLLNLLGIVVFVITMRLDWWGLLYAKLLSRLIALAYLALARPLPLAVILDQSLLVRMIRYGLPLYLNYFFSFIAERGDTLVIGWLLGTEGVAYYEVARRIPDSVLQLYQSFRRVYFPYVARAAAKGENGEIVTLIERSVRIGAFLSFFGCLIAIAFGSEIMAFLFTKSFQESAVPFAILMIATTFLMIESTFGYALSAIGDTIRPPIINVIRSVLLFIAYLVLIPTLGLIGAAIAAALAALAVIPVNAWFLRRRELVILTSTWLTPMIITVLLVLLIIALVPLGWVAQGLIIVIFLPISLAMEVITLKEIDVTWNYIKKIIDPLPISPSYTISVLNDHENDMDSIER